MDDGNGRFEHCAALTMAERGELAPGAPYADPGALGALLRRCLVQSGLASTARRAETPLAALVPDGARVLLKPNFVLHENQGPATRECLITAPALVLALLRELAGTGAAEVTVADAPVQGCRFERIAGADFRRAARAALRPEQRLQILDLRRTIFAGEELSEGVQTDARPAEAYALFDLGRRSLLEPVTDAARGFRVTNYHPEAMQRTHGPGQHQYLVAREVFEHDVVFNMPKLKMHRKAGITGALKNLVGINGNKEYLPHHRLGGAADGGDCYPGSAPLKRLAERLRDGANRHIGQRAGCFLRKGSGACTWLHQQLGALGTLGTLGTRGARGGPDTLGTRSLLRAWFDGDPELEGGWHGNDTVWRMCLDLNRILLYGHADATMAETIQRRVYTLADAIVCGEGEGPLAPEPLYVGALTFASCAVTADWLHAALLRLDPARIPLLREAHALDDWPLVARDRPMRFVCQGEPASLAAIAREYGVDARLPRGWAGHCEDVRARARAMPAGRGSCR